MATVDFHCHLDLYERPVEVANVAAEKGVYVLSVTTTPTAFAGTSQLAPAGSYIRTALGLHPELAAARRGELALFERLLPSTRYVGEIGLDGSNPHRETLDAQIGVLTDILSLCARAGGKIMTLHSRQSVQLVLDVLELEPLAGTAVLHWFSGSKKAVERATEAGCWFSVNSAMLRSAAGRAAVEMMPRDRVVTETDGPFGTFNGAPLYPWQASECIPALAKLWGMEAANAEGLVISNLRRLVGTSTN